MPPVWHAVANTGSPERFKAIIVLRKRLEIFPEFLNSDANCMNYIQANPVWYHIITC